MLKQKIAGQNLLKQEGIKEIAGGFQQSKILLTAFELGVFTALGNKSKTAAEIAKDLKTKERSTDRLMNALCAIGLLKKNKGRFLNTPLALRFLVKGRPDYMAGLMHVVHLWDNWSTLTQAVRHGKSVLAPSLNKRAKKWVTPFIAAMHERARQQSGLVVSLLNLSGVSKVLDVGGGSGEFAMAFVRAKKGISATVFDLPKVVPLTRNYIKQEKLSGKVKAISGDYLTDDLGSGFDLIFLSAIIHSNSPTQNRALIHKCARALNLKGQVVVQDFIMDKDRTHPVFGALFALNMLVATESGDTYTENEVKGWMKEAGLSHIERKDTNFGTTLLIGAGGHR